MLQETQGQWSDKGEVWMDACWTLGLCSWSGASRAPYSPRFQDPPIGTGIIMASLHWSIRPREVTVPPWAFELSQPPAVPII